MQLHNFRPKKRVGGAGSQLRAGGKGGKTANPARKRNRKSRHCKDEQAANGTNKGKNRLQSVSESPEKVREFRRKAPGGLV